MSQSIIQSPTIASICLTSNFPPFQSTELSSISSLIKKVALRLPQCTKIINIISKQQRQLSTQTQSSKQDPLESLNKLIDKIYLLVLKNNESKFEAQKIQGLLQKQQNLNRNLIKKQLQFREEHKALIDELMSQKYKSTKLNQYIGKLNQQIKDKELTIMHVKNELKACQKEKKFFDDSRVDYGHESKAKTGSRELSKQGGKHGIVQLGHKRRKSEDVNKKVVDAKKREKQKQGRKSLLLAQCKLSTYK